MDQNQVDIFNRQLEVAVSPCRNLEDSAFALAKEASSHHLKECCLLTSLITAHQVAENIARSMGMDINEITSPKDLVKELTVSIDPKANTKEQQILHEVKNPSIALMVASILATSESATWLEVKEKPPELKNLVAQELQAKVKVKTPHKGTLGWVLKRKSELSIQLRLSSSHRWTITIEGNQDTISHFVPEKKTETSHQLSELSGYKLLRLLGLPQIKGIQKLRHQFGRKQSIVLDSDPREIAPADALLIRSFLDHTPKYKVNETPSKSHSGNNTKLEIYLTNPANAEDKSPHTETAISAFYNLIKIISASSIYQQDSQTTT